MAQIKREDVVIQTTAQTTQSKTDLRTDDRCYVYVGPSFPRGKLRHGAVMTGTKFEVERYLEDEIARCPQVKALLVPLSRLAENRKMAMTEGSALHKLCADVSATFVTEKK